MSNVVGIIYDRMTDQVELQICRDLMLLKGEFPDLSVHDPAGKMDEAMLSAVGVPATLDEAQTVIVYKTGPDWPEVDPNIDVIERDLCPGDGAPKLDGDERPGYYLRPQGRDGANLTDVYLNRSYPRGNGVTDPLVILLWS